MKKPNAGVPLSFRLWAAMAAALGILVAGGGISPARGEAAKPSLGEEDDGLPQPLDQQQFEPLRKRSPFLRTLNLADTYSFRGLATIDGKPVATLYNKETTKTILVTKEAPNDQGIQMVETTDSDELQKVAIKVSFAGEEVVLKYEEAQITPQPRSPSGRDGNRGRDGDRGSDRRRGPSEQDRERYNSLTQEQKEKFHQYIRQTMQKYPDISQEERGNMIRGAMTRLLDGRDITLDGPSSSSPSAGGGGSSSRSGDGRR